LRLARAQGVAMQRHPMDPVMNPMPSARAFAWVKHHHPALAAAVAHAIFDAYWAEGRDLSTPDALRSLTLPDGLCADALADAASGDEAAALLREMVDASVKAGVFGAPTVVVDGEPFWGVDRLDEVDRWLVSGGW